jgi:uncharacterized protein (TIGR02147 family)
MDFSYQEVLKGIYAEKALKNKSYSMRAFARDLSVDVGLLSHVLKGSKNFSLETATKVSEKIFTHKADRVYFLKLVTFQKLKGPDAEKAKKDLQELKVHSKEKWNLSVADFNYVSKWYHIPIAVYTELKNSSSEPKKIAKYFGIDETAAEFAIDRLLKLKILELKNKKLTRALKVFNVRSDVPSTSIRTYHKEMINKALVAIDAQSIERRYLRGLTFSLESKNIDKVHKLIEDFYTDLSLLSSQQKNPDLIYQLNTQFFDLESKANDS